MRGSLSMKIAMWSRCDSPVSRKRCAIWLAAASYSAKVTTWPLVAMTIAGLSGCASACFAAYTVHQGSRTVAAGCRGGRSGRLGLSTSRPEAPVERVDQAPAHQRERLVLEVVAHERAPDTGHRVRERDLAARAHVPERLVIRAVL